MRNNTKVTWHARNKTVKMFNSVLRICGANEFSSDVSSTQTTKYKYKYLFSLQVHAKYASADANTLSTNRSNVVHLLTSLYVKTAL